MTDTPRPTRETGSKVIDLMVALKESLAGRQAYCIQCSAAWFNGETCDHHPAYANGAQSTP